LWILTNKEIHAIVKKPTITETIRLHILRWFGQVQRREENRIPKTVLYMNLESTRTRGRPRNRRQDKAREDGRTVGGEEWQGKVYNREEWKKLLRTARNRRILHMPMELMNEYELHAVQQHKHTQFCFYLFLTIHNATSQFIHRLRVFENSELFKASAFTLICFNTLGLAPEAVTKVRISRRRTKRGWLGAHCELRQSPCARSLAQNTRFICVYLTFRNPASYI
jgi:hypothetical protein